MTYKQREGMGRYESIRGHFQGFQQSGANGHRAIILAVIAVAEMDYLDGDADAVDYFRGEAYQFHLDYLDLPRSYLPIGVRE